MLPVLKEVPQNSVDWDRYAFHNMKQIDLIRQAILAQRNITLTPYVLYPIPLDDPTNWLQNNQAAHTDFNGVLGLQSHDIEELDFNNPDEVFSWINLVYQELFDASSALGV